MSTTPKQLEDLAKYVMEHPALEEIQRRIAEKMLKKFRTGNAEMREQINAIMDADVAFLSELRAILAENQEVDNNE